MSKPKRTRAEYLAQCAANTKARLAREQRQLEAEIKEEVAYIVKWAPVQPLPAKRTRAVNYAIAHGLIAAVDGLLVPAGAP